MKKTVFTTVFLLISIFIYAREVSASNQGIANASPGDYIIRSTGEIVELKQADIDYARRQLGFTTHESIQSGSPSSNNNRSDNYSNSNNTVILVFLLIVVGIIIIIGICVSNITTTAAKNSGMDEESAKKVGVSAGVLAGTAAAIGAAILLGKAGEVKRNPNDLTITHKRG